MEIKNETINKILNVLGSLPYVQVAGLLQEIQQELQVKPILEKNTKPKTVGKE